MISAKIVLDSVSPQGYRLTTFQLRYPKFIHGELMTHRKFSRNASSSRAVPVARSLEEVRSDELRAAPVHWGAEQKGMASGDELTGVALDQAKIGWAQAANMSAFYAEFLQRAGVHKSIVNRILEPFLHINVVVSATDYANFFGLRLDHAAQPEMRTLAEAMWKEYGESQPDELFSDCWHLPYVEPEDYGAMGWEDGFVITGDPAQATPIKVSVARCARVSYANFDTGRRSTVEEDLRLYDRLMGAQPVHASPAEHQATPDAYRLQLVEGQHVDAFAHPEQHGNFTGWRQYRKMVPGEEVAPLPEGYTPPTGMR